MGPETHDTALLPNKPQLRPQTIEHSPRIHRKREIPVLIAHLSYALSQPDDPGHIHRSIQSTEPLYSRLNPMVYGCRGRDITDRVHVFFEATWEGGCCGLEGCCVYVCEGDEGAAGGEELGCCQAHAGGGACYGDLQGFCSVSFPDNP